jgi:hypothetical protein
MIRHSLVVFALVLNLVPFLRGQDKAPTPEQVRFFENQVRPLLAEQCHKCHGSQKQRGDLRLDSRKAILEGGQSGPAIVPGKPEQSRIIDAVNYRNGIEMPPKMRLTPKQIDTLTQWVKMGAPWPESGEAKPLVPRKGPLVITAEDRQFWSFRPVRKPNLSEIRNPKSEIQNPIDLFLLAKLEAKELSFSEPAPKRELLRRATFDLTGLPPTPEEVDAFMSDSRPDAYERLVDRLLASPAYGERWGRHWLDVVRFGQTNGYERDDEKPNAWRYRDYVIRAFNQDLPFDRFIREQLAGDELPDATDDSLIATGFYRLGVWDDEPDDARQAEFDELDDMLSTAGSSFLGLTIGCARCHDHKFDPMGQEDYYSMLAFVRNVHRYAKPDKDAEKTIQAKLKKGGQALAVHEYGRDPRPTQILVRGNAGTPGKQVEPRFVRVLCPSDEKATPTLAKPADTIRTTGRRRVLADWIASQDNPLTARVIVNRLWQHHFGKGIVATSNDFGKTGVAPTHPELLDWLASELVEGGWTLKRLHKQIMMSRAYMQSSRAVSERGKLVDPGNTLLWRQNPRRLEAEAIRDSILSVSGNLNRAMGGRGIFPTLPPEVLSTQSMPGRGWDRCSAEEQARRSVYIFVKRTLGVPLLETFDFASPDTSAPVRATTTIAPQALILLNSGFMEHQSKVLAERLIRETGKEPGANVERLYRLAVGRHPTERERNIAEGYLKRVQQGMKGENAYRDALVQLAKVILNLNEMVYID